MENHSCEEILQMAFEGFRQMEVGEVITCPFRKIFEPLRYSISILIILASKK